MHSRLKYFLLLIATSTFLSLDLFAQEILLQKGHDNKSYYMEVHPNGRYVATSESDLRIWDIYSRKLLNVLRPGNAATSIMRFSKDPSSNFLLTTSEESAYVYLIDIAKGSVVNRWFLGEDFLPTTMEWKSPKSGKTTGFYIVGFNEIREYEIDMEDFVSSRQLNQTMMDSDNDIAADDWGVRNLDAFSKSNRLGVITEINSFLLRFYDTLCVVPFDAKLETDVMKLTLGSHLWSWDYCESNNSLAVATDEDFKLFDLNSGKILWEQPNLWTDWEHQIKISKNGKFLFLDRNDSSDVLNWETGQRMLHLTPTVTLAEFTHDNEYLVVGGWKAPFVFSLQTGKMQEMDVYDNKLNDIEQISDRLLLLKDRWGAPSDSVYFDLTQMDYTEVPNVVNLEYAANFDPAVNAIYITGPRGFKKTVPLNFEINGIPITALPASHNKVSAIAVSGDGRYVYVAEYVVDPMTSSSTRKRMEKKGYLSYNPDKTRLRLAKYDVASGARMDVSALIKSYHEMELTMLNRDAQLLLSSGDLVKVYDTEKLSEISDISPPQPDNWFVPIEECIYLPKNKIILINQSGSLHVHNAEDFSKLQTIALPFRYMTGTALKATDKLLVFGADGNEDLVTIDLKSLSILEKRKLSDRQIRRLIVFDDFLLALYFDGQLDFIDAKDGMKIASLIADPISREFVLFDSSGVYYGTKQLLNHVTLTDQLRCYSVAQFDARFNKPHEILAKLPFVDKAKVALMKKVYDKRLQQGMRLKMLEISDAPFIEVEPIAFETSELFIDLKLRAKSSGVSLRKLRVIANGASIYGSNDLTVSLTTHLDTNLRIALITGENDILISVLDSMGEESAIERRRVNCLKDDGKDSLIMITIAVSSFMQSAYDLKYAVKDGRDLLDVFSKQNVEYVPNGLSSYQVSKTHLIIDSLFDKAVTKENVQKLKERLGNLRPQDRVILSLSGHGLLDDSLNWWFATYDMDFEAPSQRGLSYELIMDLLADCPSRQKLLLLDACHSGELDRSVNYSDDNSISLQDGVVKIGTRGAKARKSSSLDLEGSYALMKEYFADNSDGSGVHVIAAASGDSYALESDKWENGVFTGSVIDALQSAHVSSGLSISELRTAVSSRVSRLTNGFQQPMTRAGSSKYDFRIFE